MKKRADFDGHWRDHRSVEEVIVEAWSQGLMVGSLLVMAVMTIGAMRKSNLLHKLILFEQLLAIPHGTFCFMSFNGYGWYVSSTATLLYASYVLHNFVAWVKVRTFFSGNGVFFKRRTSQIIKWSYLSSYCMTIPFWIFEVYNNFCFNNNIRDLFDHTRLYEPLARDPWWLFTNIILLDIVRRSYDTGILQLVSRSARFGLTVMSIFLAIVFTLMDILASALGPPLSTLDGINPYWKLSLVFKCLTDVIMLDDFKTELDRLSAARRETLQRESFPVDVARSPMVNGSQSQDMMNLRFMTDDEGPESEKAKHSQYAEVEDLAAEPSKTYIRDRLS